MSDSPMKKRKTANVTEQKEKESVVLYSYWRSSCSWRVRIALALKNIAYDYVPIHLVKGEQKGADYSKQNPMQQVPFLMIDGHGMAQSMAVLEYLEETRPEPALLPAVAADRAKVRQMCEMINAGIQPIQNFAVLGEVKKLTGEDASRFAWGALFIDRGFQALEQEIKRTAGKYSFGDSITLVDLLLVPQIYNARRFKVDMDQFPSILAVEKNLQTHAAFKAAHPDQQPDAQPV